jgi:hypothetical protein
MTVGLLNSMFNLSFCLTSFIVVFWVIVVFVAVVVFSLYLLCIHCGRVSFIVVFCVLCFD